MRMYGNSIAKSVYDQELICGVSGNWLTAVAAAQFPGNDSRKFTSLLAARGRIRVRKLDNAPMERLIYALVRSCILALSNRWSAGRTRRPR